ncbi:AAA family ATPase [Tumebacillus flagellatus]|uniref:HD domain-containing protein n=1 Tax=Tumebacillus flagellatus TaxID=1157490 RepID=A0A074LHZ2_9BACL|nr:AAA family ATPase [Tumebacillus flagellatus]KEO81856.1 hypothetical protein EL26_18635 [Tumebacillus flagellatus]
MPVLTIYVGFPTISKSRSAHTYAAESDALLVRYEEDKVEKVPRDVTDALKAGRSVVIDGPNRLPKQRKLFLDAARRFGCKTEVIYHNVTLEQAEADSSADRRALLKYQRHLQVPTYAEDLDRLDVQTDEPVLTEARDFFHEQEKKLIADPVRMIRTLEADGRLQRWLPELAAAIAIDQHNPHHRFTVYEHILKATEVVAGSSLKFVWTMLLHDIGKAYPGIKQFTGFLTQDYERWRKKDFVIIENGADIREGRDSGEFYVVSGRKIPKEYVNTDLAGHFYQHENIGAQMAFRILTRFGYSHDFAREVMALIQFHMTLPFEKDTCDLSYMRKFYEVVGRYAADLVLVRLADSRGK